VSWTVRGIYNEYAGWFDENPASMYALPPSSVYPEMVQLAGGVDRIASKARELLNKGEYVKTLHLTAVALASALQNPGIQQIRLEALEKLKQSTFNYIERIWLDFGIRQCQEALKIREPASSGSD
jgi:alkyl sulfatase BDS1-like metallo-beta-lactamase superfamily hydrolase